MPYTPAPPAPARNRPAQFADEGDAFLGWLPGFNDFCEEVRQTAEEAIDASVVAESSASIAIAAANYKGPWASLTGALAKPASVSHNNALWLLNTNLADVTTAEPGVSPAWARIKPALDVYGYDSRASLRALVPATGDFAAVRGLGVFAWQAGSTRPDDDETVFATTGGAWELVAADPDYVHAHLEGLRDDVEALEWDTYEAAAAAAAAQATASAAQAAAGTAQATADTLAARILRGTFSMSLTSLAATTSSSFTCTVTGAAVGDSVIVNPGNGFGTASTDQARLSYVAYVSAANTVTVTVRNASAATAAITASTWTAIVIKQ